MWANVGHPCRVTIWLWPRLQLSGRSRLWGDAIVGLSQAGYVIAGIGLRWRGFSLFLPPPGNLTERPADNCVTALSALAKLAKSVLHE